MVGPDRVDTESLVRMTRSLTHRGPDDEGFLSREYEDGNAVGLGFRRLSIVDLDSGNQPIGNESGAVQVVFNGEIYNFPTLRRELEERGHRFSTHADTEVIPHLYEELGHRCVERLNGMFAFALWDETRRELLLARDRFGKKPLYYAHVGRSLIFGSELKSLLEHPSCPSELDPAGLSRYLALEYVPTPFAIFAGVTGASSGPLQPGLRLLGMHPAHGATRFALDVSSPADVAVVLYDAAGRSVRTLARGRYGPGSHDLAWDGKDDRGAGCRRGVYFVRTRIGAFEGTRKVVML